MRLPACFCSEVPNSLGTVGMSTTHQSTQVGDLLSKDPCDLDLSLEFWSPVETSSGRGPGGINRRAPQRQLSLFNFIRLCSDLLPALLFSPFMHMLTGLCNSVKTAHHGFNFLKANSPSLGMLGCHYTCS